MCLQYWAGKCHHHSRLKQKDTTENVTKLLSTESMTHKAEVHEFLWERHEVISWVWGHLKGTFKYPPQGVGGVRRKQHTGFGGGGGEGERGDSMYGKALHRKPCLRIHNQKIRSEKDLYCKSPLQQPKTKAARRQLK